MSETKQQLHTQGVKWEVHSTGSLPSKAEIHPANDPDGLIIIADVYKYEDAELIVKAVNSYEKMVAQIEIKDSLVVQLGKERQALLDANKKMKEALEAIVARLNGEFDNPSLLLFGELSDSETDDIEGFAKDALIN